jgi:hypothetical protein
VQANNILNSAKDRLSRLVNSRNFENAKLAIWFNKSFFFVSIRKENNNIKGSHKSCNCPRFHPKNITFTREISHKRQIRQKKFLFQLCFLAPATATFKSTPADFISVINLLTPAASFFFPYAFTLTQKQ